MRSCTKSSVKLKSYMIYKNRWSGQVVPHSRFINLVCLGTVGHSPVSSITIVLYSSCCGTPGLVLSAPVLFFCRFQNLNRYVVGACFCGVTWSIWSQVHLVPYTLCPRPGASCRVHCTRYLYRLPRSRNQRPGSSYQVLVAGTRDPATGTWYQQHGTSDQVHGPAT